MNVYIQRALHYLKLSCVCIQGKPCVYTYVCVCWSLQSCLTLCDPMDCIAHQAPLSMGFSRQEYWSGLPFPSLVHKMKSESEVTQSCPTLSDPMDCIAHQAPPSMGFSRQEHLRTMIYKQDDMNLGGLQRSPRPQIAPCLLMYSFLQTHLLRVLMSC